jgi:hypothetical protein
VRRSGHSCRSALLLHHCRELRCLRELHRHRGLPRRGQSCYGWLLLRRRRDNFRRRPQ